MKKVLIISELFYPNNQIGALRPSKICKCLLERGYSVDVITAYESGGIYNSENCRVFDLKGKLPEKIQNKSSAISGNSRIIKEIKTFKRKWLSYKSGRHYANEALKLFENGVINAENYDACFTTYGPISSVMIGLELKKRYNIKNWICDFRDPMVSKVGSVFLIPLYRRLQKKACKYADKIVAVSNGYLERICEDKYADKKYMIPNGYDTSDMLFDFKKSNNEKLTFAYVGSLYEGKRETSQIFKAISELEKEGKISSEKIKFVYAGGNFNVLKAQAEKYGMQDILDDKGRLGRKDCLELQYNSDILVLSTWNEKGEYGVFPGKFLEYMLIGRPIVAVVTGDLPDSEVAQVMREGNFGAVYEQANDSEDFEKLKDYIEKQYNTFINTGDVEFSPQSQVLDRYDYKNIIDRIEVIIN